MKRTYRALAMILALLMVITVFAIPVAAEGESMTEDSSAEVSPAPESSEPEESVVEASVEESASESSEEVIESSEEIAESSEEVIESSEEVVESSEEIIESSEEVIESSDEVIESSDEVVESSEENTESSEDPVPTTYKINITVNGVADAFTARFNDAVVSGNVYEGSSSTVEMIIEPKEGYEITAAYFERNTDFTSSNGKYVLTAKRLEVGEEYNVTVETKLIPVPVQLNIETVGVLGYSLTVNDKKVEEGFNSFYTGDTVYVSFEISNSGSEFDPAMAILTLNGQNKILDGAYFEFVITENTRLIFTYGVVAVKFMLNGPGKFVLTPAISDSVSGIENTGLGSVERIYYLQKGAYYTLQLTPGTNFERSGDFEISGISRFETRGNTVYFYADSSMSIMARTVESEGEESIDKFIASLTVGIGGKVLCGSQTVSGGSGTNIVVSDGTDLEFEILPDEGYEIDTFTVDGNEVEIVDGKVTVEGISSDVEIRVLFKLPGEEGDGIGANDVSWDAENIVIDVTDGTLVGASVFEKIKELPDNGKFVEFKSEYGSVYVPYGGETGGTGALADMTITRLTEGEIFDDITETVKMLGKDSIPYNMFMLNVGRSLPKGSEIAFNVDIVSATNMVSLYSYDSANKTFYMDKNSAGGVMLESGTRTGRYPLGLGGAMIVADNSFMKFTIDAVVSTAGGTITPNGQYTVSMNSSVTYTMSALAGYIIDSVVVDGKVQAGAKGQTTFSHTFNSVNANHTIEVKYSPIAGDTGDTDDGGNSKPLVATLIIVLVAVAGASAMFAIKWRQEKAKE